MGWLFKGVPAAPILEFLTNFRSHPGALLTNGEPIRRYIEERREDELAEWDVLFPSVRDREDGDVLTDESLGFTIRCQYRIAGEGTNTGALLVSSRQRVSTRGVERTGLSAAQRMVAEEKYRSDLASAGRMTEGRPVNFPDRVYREQRTRPLIVVHMLDIRMKVDDPPTSQAVVAWSISFPKTNREEKRVEYVVNTTWWRERYGDDLEEEEMLGDR